MLGAGAAIDACGARAVLPQNPPLTEAGVSGAAPAALVISPPEGMIKALPPGISITSIGPYSVTLRGGAGLVAAFYAAGAPLVLPAGLTGCLPQTAI